MLKRRVKLTPKQKEVLGVIIKTNKDGTLRDLDQILMNIRYYSTKQSIQFVIRSLIKKGLITKSGSENRRGRRRVLLAPTMFGLQYARSLRSEGLDKKAGRNLSESILKSLKEVVSDESENGRNMGPILDYDL